LASKNWRIAGVAPAGVEGVEDDIREGAVTGHDSDALSGAKHRSITSDPEPHRRSASLVILALDTTTRAGSVAILRDGEILSEINGDASLTHGQRLPAEFRLALETAGVALDDVGLLAVVAGPGSFTGLRVGIAAIQGLAFSRGLSVVPVSALEAIGRHTLRTTTPDALVAPWIDAQRGEVFAILYDGDVERPLVPPSSAPPQATLDALLDLGLTSARDEGRSRPIIFAGDGAVRYKDAIARALGARAAVLEPAPALAAEAARLAARHPERAVVPHAIVPIYVRRPDAELARGRAGR
jgi:tRNA threonylcarbamoyladenosine biosynthesis protein TsaB